MAKVIEAASHTHAEPTGKPCYLQMMEWQVGVTEATGRNDGPMVAAYLQSVGLPEGHPWCGALPHWCYRQCGRVLQPPHMFARAAHWHTKDRRVWERGGKWEYSKDFQRVSIDGDHGALYYSHINRIGHTFVIYAEDERYFYTIEGNTNDGGSREGIMVALRKRLKSAVYCVSRW